MKLSLSGLAGRTRLSVRRRSPEIFTFGGILIGAIGTVAACRATIKAVPVIEEHKENTDKIRTEYGEGTNTTELGRELTKEWLHTIGDLIVLYTPSFALGSLSAASILAGNNILRKRNIALAAAYTALDSSFSGYRKRVSDRYGDDTEHEIYYGLDRETMEETITNENRVTYTVETDRVTADGLPNAYARWFTYGESKAAEHNDDYNDMFLENQEAAVNIQFKARQFLFLNDVYELLGYDKTVEGQSVGWVYDRYDDGNGSRFISFGKQRVWRKDSTEPDGGKWVWMLVFNVEGPIFERAVARGLLKT